MRSWLKNIFLVASDIYAGGGNRSIFIYWMDTHSHSIGIYSNSDSHLEQRHEHQNRIGYNLRLSLS